jgi:hypothetical protein
MMLRIVSAFMIVWSATPGVRTFEWVGSFADVKSSTGEHCRGYSLNLWRSDGRVIGLLDVHAGLCGDPPCGVIEDVSLDSRTGRLAFTSSIGGVRWTFAGRLMKDAVTGALNGQRVRLNRDRDEKNWVDFKPNLSLGAWCEFWSGVRRCGGVRELCSSLQAR